MKCCVTDLRNKQVINEKTGDCLGFVCDVEIDTCCGQVLCLIIFGRSKCLGLLGHEPDILIRWEDVKVIGADTILVCAEVKGHGKKEGGEGERSRGRGMFPGFFR